jgi:hypothetical protein
LLYRYFCSSTTGDVWFCWRRMILPLSEAIPRTRSLLHH